jgi:acetoin utilization protein AcuB
MQVQHQRFSIRQLARVIARCILTINARENQMSAKTIQQFMTPNPITIERHQPLSAARKLMQDKNIRHLPVVQNGKLVGLISNRDLQFIETLGTLDIETSLVEDAMLFDPLHFGPDATLREVAQSMVASKAGSAVIIKQESVIGIFTNVDALHALTTLA